MLIKLGLDVLQRPARRLGSPCCASTPCKTPTESSVSSLMGMISTIRRDKFKLAFKEGLVLPEFSCASQLLPRWILVVASLAAPLLSGLAGLPHGLRELGDCMPICLGCDRRSYAVPLPLYTACSASCWTGLTYASNSMGEACVCNSTLSRAGPPGATGCVGTVASVCIA